MLLLVSGTFFVKEFIMLGKILSKATCADCRVCCSFDNYDLWETPVVSDSVKALAETKIPDVKFVPRGESYLFRMDDPDGDGLYFCPALTETGCILGDEKPFDCKIWPYRIMNLAGVRVITLSPVCESVFALPIKTVVDTARELAPTIFAYADENPDIVKDYIDGHAILIVEKSSK